MLNDVLEVQITQVSENVRVEYFPPLSDKIIFFNLCTFHPFVDWVITLVSSFQCGLIPQRELEYYNYKETLLTTSFSILK